MARNEEKAMAMLNRWVKMKREINQKKTGGVQMDRRQRPEDPSEVDNVAQGEFWRSSIVKQITGKVSEIQNGSLGEYKIRELNDAINDLLKEKLKWEARIAELGGKDYKADRELYGKATPADGGVSILGADGYLYFGAAKNLPRVRELLQKEVPVITQKTNLKDLYRPLDATYFGLTEDDPALLAQEKDAESALLSERAAIQMQEKFLQKKRRRIELMQVQTKEVGLSQLSVADLRALLMEGVAPETVADEPTTKMREHLQKAGSIDEAAQESHFSKDMKLKAAQDAAASGDSERTRQRNELLSVYASKELATQQKTKIT